MTGPETGKVKVRNINGLILGISSQWRVYTLNFDDDKWQGTDKWRTLWTLWTILTLWTLWTVWSLWTLWTLWRKFQQQVTTTSDNDNWQQQVIVWVLWVLIGSSNLPENKKFSYIYTCFLEGPLSLSNQLVRVLLCFTFFRCSGLLSLVIFNYSLHWLYFLLDWTLQMWRIF